MTARGCLYSSRLQKLISLITWVEKKNAPVLLACQYGLPGLDVVCLLGAFIACSSSFLSCHVENSSQSQVRSGGRSIKAGCTMSCWGDETDSTFFCALFLDFGHWLPSFATNSRVVDLVRGSAPVEHPHNLGKHSRLIGRLVWLIFCLENTILFQSWKTMGIKRWWYKIGYSTAKIDFSTPKDRLWHSHDWLYQSQEFRTEIHLQRPCKHVCKMGWAVIVMAILLFTFTSVKITGWQDYILNRAVWVVE